MTAARVDGVIPVLTLVAPTGDYGVGSILEFTVQGDEAISVFGSGNAANVTFDLASVAASVSQPRKATYTSGEGTPELKFAYEITPQDIAGGVLDELAFARNTTTGIIEKIETNLNGNELIFNVTFTGDVSFGSNPELIFSLEGEQTVATQGDNQPTGSTPYAEYTVSVFSPLPNTRIIGGVATLTDVENISNNEEYTPQQLTQNLTSIGSLSSSTAGIISTAGLDLSANPVLNQIRIQEGVLAGEPLDVYVELNQRVLPFGGTTTNNGQVNITVGGDVVTLPFSYASGTTLVYTRVLGDDQDGDIDTQATLYGFRVENSDSQELSISDSDYTINNNDGTGTALTIGESLRQVVTDTSLAIDRPISVEGSITDIAGNEGTTPSLTPQGLIVGNSIGFAISVQDSLWSIKELGDTITVELQFSEPVVFTQQSAPYITFSFSETPRQDYHRLTYESGNTEDTLLFTYEVREGDVGQLNINPDGLVITQEQISAVESTDNRVIALSNNGASGTFAIAPILEGAGRQDNPYLISDIYDFYVIKDDLNAYYELANDINADVPLFNANIPLDRTTDLSATARTFPGRDVYFSGNIDGSGYAISGLVLDTPLFSITGTIQNIEFENTNFKDFIFDYLEGTIENVKITSSVSGPRLISFVNSVSDDAVLRDILVIVSQRTSPSWSILNEDSVVDNVVVCGLSNTLVPRYHIYDDGVGNRITDRQEGTPESNECLIDTDIEAFKEFDFVNAWTRIGNENKIELRTFADETEQSPYITEIQLAEGELTTGNTVKFRVIFNERVSYTPSNNAVLQFSIDNNDGDDTNDARTATVAPGQNFQQPVNDIIFDYAVVRADSGVIILPAGSLLNSAITDIDNNLLFGYFGNADFTTITQVDQFRPYITSVEIYSNNYFPNYANASDNVYVAIDFNEKVTADQLMLDVDNNRGDAVYPFIRATPEGAAVHRYVAEVDVNGNLFDEGNTTFSIQGNFYSQENIFGSVTDRRIYDYNDDNPLSQQPDANSWVVLDFTPPSLDTISTREQPYNENETLRINVTYVDNFNELLIVNNTHTTDNPYLIFNLSSNGEQRVNNSVLAYEPYYVNDVNNRNIDPLYRLDDDGIDRGQPFGVYEARVDTTNFNPIDGINWGATEQARNSNGRLHIPGEQDDVGSLITTDQSFSEIEEQRLDYTYKVRNGDHGDAIAEEIQAEVRDKAGNLADNTPPEEPFAQVEDIVSPRIIGELLNQAGNNIVRIIQELEINEPRATNGYDTDPDANGDNKLIDVFNVTFDEVVTVTNEDDTSINITLDTLANSSVTLSERLEQAYISPSLNTTLVLGEDGNNYVLGKAVPDEIAPEILNITVKEDVSERETLEFYVDFSEDITVTGTPTLNFTLGGYERVAIYDSVENNRVTFEYPDVTPISGGIVSSITTTYSTDKLIFNVSFTNAVSIDDTNNDENKGIIFTLDGEELIAGQPPGADRESNAGASSYGVYEYDLNGETGMLGEIATVFGVGTRDSPSIPYASDRLTQKLSYDSSFTHETPIVGQTTLRGLVDSEVVLGIDGATITDDTLNQATITDNPYTLANTGIIAAEFTLLAVRVQEPVTVGAPLIVYADFNRDVDASIIPNNRPSIRLVLEDSSDPVVTNNIRTNATSTQGNRVVFESENIESTDLAKKIQSDISRYMLVGTITGGGSYGIADNLGNSVSSDNITYPVALANTEEITITGIDTPTLPTPSFLRVRNPNSVEVNEPLSFYVDFSEDITVTGTPTLSFEVNGNTRVATWTEQGSATPTGGHTLTFNYTPDNEDIGVISEVNFNLDNVVIEQATAALAPLVTVNTDALVGTPYQLTNQIAISPPNTIVNARVQEGAQVGDNIEFYIDFNENITTDTNTGSPTLTYTSNDVEKTAAYDSTISSGNVLGFTANEAFVEADTGTIEQTVTLNLNSVTITPTSVDTSTTLELELVNTATPITEVSLFNLAIGHENPIISHSATTPPFTNGLRFNYFVVTPENNNAPIFQRDNTYHSVFRGENEVYGINETTQTLYVINPADGTQESSYALTSIGTGIFTHGVEYSEDTLYALINGTSLVKITLDSETNTASEETVITTKPATADPYIVLASEYGFENGNQLAVYDGKVYITETTTGDPNRNTHIYYPETEFVNQLDTIGVDNLADSPTQITFVGIQGDTVYYLGKLNTGANEELIIITAPLDNYNEGHQHQERVAQYASGSGTNTLTFNYTVTDETADEAEHGIRVSTDTLSETNIVDINNNEINKYNYTSVEEQPFTYRFEDAFVNRRPQVELTAEPANIRTGSTLGEDIDIIAQATDRHSLESWNLTVDFSDGFDEIIEPTDSSIFGPEYGGSAYNFTSDNVSGVGVSFKNIIYAEQLAVDSDNKSLNQILVNGKFVVNVDDPSTIPGYNNYITLLTALGARNNVSSEVGVATGRTNSANLYDLIDSTPNDKQAELIGDVKIPIEQISSFNNITDTFFITPETYQIYNESNEVLIPVKLLAPISYGVIEGTDVGATPVANQLQVPIQIQGSVEEDILIRAEFVNAGDTSSDDYILEHQYTSASIVLTGAGVADQQNAEVTFKTISKGSTSATLDFNITQDDALEENEEQINIRFSVVGENAEFTQNETQVTIIDDDKAPAAGGSAISLETSAVKSRVDEGENAEVIVSLPTGTTTEESISFVYEVVATIGNYDVSASDYVLNSNIGTIQAGQTQTTISIPIVDDAIVEASGVIDATDPTTEEYEHLGLNFAANDNNVEFTSTNSNVDIEIDDNDIAEIRFYGSDRLDHKNQDDVQTVGNDVLRIDVNEGAEDIGPILEVVSGPAEVPLVFDLYIVGRQQDDPRKDSLDEVLVNQGVSPDVSLFSVQYAENTDFIPVLDDTNSRQKITIPVNTIIHRAVLGVNVSNTNDNNTDDNSAGTGPDGEDQEAVAIYFDDTSSPDNVYVSKEDPERVILVINEDDTNTPSSIPVQHIWLFSNSTEDTVDSTENVSYRVIFSELVPADQRGNIALSINGISSQIEYDTPTNTETIENSFTESHGGVHGDIVTLQLTNDPTLDLHYNQDSSEAQIAAGKPFKDSVSYKVTNPDSARRHVTISSQENFGRLGEKIALLDNGRLGIDCSDTATVGCFNDYTLSAVLEQTPIAVVYEKRVTVPSEVRVQEAQEFTIEVGIERRGAEEVVIGYRSIAGTALEGEQGDYTVHGGNITFSATEQKKQVLTIPPNIVYEDNTPEGDEYYELEFFLESGSELEKQAFENKSVRVIIGSTDVTAGVLTPTTASAAILTATADQAVDLDTNNELEVLGYEVALIDFNIESASYTGNQVLRGLELTDSNQNSYVISATVGEDETISLERDVQNPAFLIGTVNNQFTLNKEYLGQIITFNNNIPAENLSVDGVILEEPRRDSITENVTLSVVPNTTGDSVIIENGIVTSAEGSIRYAEVTLADVILSDGKLGAYNSTNSNFIEILGVNDTTVSTDVVIELDDEGKSVKAKKASSVDANDLDLTINVAEFWGTVIAEDYDGMAQATTTTETEVVGFVRGTATDGTSADDIKLVSGEYEVSTTATNFNHSLNFTHTLRNHLYGLDALDADSYTLTFSAQDEFDVKSIQAPDNNVANDPDNENATFLIGIGEIARQILPSTGGSGSSGSGGGTSIGDGGFITEFGPLSSSDEQLIRRAVNTTTADSGDIVLVSKFITPRGQEKITITLDALEQQILASTTLTDEETQAFIEALNELRALAIEELTLEHRTRVGLYRIENCASCTETLVTFVERHIYIDELVENGYADDTRLRFVEVIPKSIVKTASEVTTIAQVFFEDPLLYQDRDLGELKDLSYFDSSYALLGDKVAQISASADVLVLVIPNDIEEQKELPLVPVEPISSMERTFLAMTIAIIIALIILLGIIIVIKRSKRKR